MNETLEFLYKNSEKWWSDLSINEMKFFHKQYVSYNSWYNVSKLNKLIIRDKMGNDSSKGGGGPGSSPAEKNETKSLNIFEKIINNAKPSSSKEK